MDFPPTTEDLRLEWTTAIAAPWLFLGGLIVAGLVIWWLLRWRYLAIIDKKGVMLIAADREVLRLKGALEIERGKNKELMNEISTLIPAPIRFKVDGLADAQQIAEFVEEIENRARDIMGKAKDLIEYAPYLRDAFRHQSRITQDRLSGRVMGDIAKRLTPEQVKNLRRPLDKGTRDLHRMLDEFCNFLFVT